MRTAQNPHQKRLRTSNLKKPLEGSIMLLIDLIKEKFDSRYHAAESFNVSHHLLNNWISDKREVLQLLDGRWILINQKNKIISVVKCDHLWIANSGKGGQPDFKVIAGMSLFPLMHVQCEKCNDRTFLTKKNWFSIQEKL